MTLHFEETTPGVHMAMWENPNSGNARTVIIIESLGQFTLYIDGDVAARDMDSFETAASRAQSMLTSGGSRRMVQMASAMVVFAAVGGAAIGLTHLMSGTSGIASAVTADTQSIVKDVTAGEKKTAETQFTTFKRVTPQSKPIVVSSIEPTSTSASVPAAAPVSPVVINSTLPAQTEPSEAKIENTSEQTLDTPAQPAAPRIFSATRPVFVDRPAQQPVAKVEQAASPVSTQSSTLAAADEPRPAKPTNVAIGNEASTEIAAADPQSNMIEPEALPLPDRNPLPRFAALEKVEKDDDGFGPATSAPAVQVAPSPYQTNAMPARKKRTAEAAYQKMMERAAAKRRAKLEKRRRTLKAKANAKRKVVKKKSTKKVRRTVRRKSRRVMRCMIGGCRWVARGGYYDRQYRRAHY